MIRPASGELSIADHGLIGDGRGWALVGRDGTIRQMSLPHSGGPPLSGELVVAPGHVLGSRQYYLGDTGVLITEMRCPTGLVEVADMFTLRSGVDLTGDVPAARGELLRYVRVLEGRASLRIVVSPVGSELSVFASCPLAGRHTTVEVEVGDEHWLLLRWEPHIHETHHGPPRELLEQTTSAWRRWSQVITYDGPQADAVRRSALTVKLLGCTDPGDAAALGFALRRIGLAAEAERLLGDVLDALEDKDQPPGWDGDVLDCAFQWAVGGGTVHDLLWNRLVNLAERAEQSTDTYGVAMHRVALDRAARLSRSLHLPGDPAGWSAHAAVLRDRILQEAWDDTRQSLTGKLGPGGDLDARLLTLPARHVIPADHPRMTATVHAIADRLGAIPETVLAHSFRLADNILGQGHQEEAADLFDALCLCANSVGLLPEQIDTEDGSFLGRFPHVSTHVAMIATGVALTQGPNAAALTARLPGPAIQRRAVALFSRIRR